MKFIFILTLIISTNVFSLESSNLAIINKSLASAMDMFGIASKKYEKGELTKEQYIKIALEVNKLSESAKNANNPQNVPISNFVNGQKYTNNPNVNIEAIAKIKADYQAYLKSTKANDVKEWGNGKLYRRAYGALYVDNYNGDSVYLNDMTKEDLDYQRIAEINSSIRKFWNEKYGFQLYVPGIAYLTSSSQEKVQPVYRTKILSWLKEMNQTIKIGQSKKWNGLTVVKTSNPGCAMLLSKDGLDMSSICESDNFEKTISENAFLSKTAAQYWGHTAASK
ncbi:MAG: hypothetical protein H7177_05595 [Rhizobacter sp.]|nr:hypothetical protein [Bacteriovorax sp.]